MKISFWITFFFSLLLLLLLSCANSAQKPPGASAGILDLEHWDIEEKGSVRLNGNWEFYYDRFLGPDDFVNGRNNFCNPKMIKVPESWHNVLKRASSYGFGTYRLKIKLGRIIENLALYFHYVYTSYKVYVNSRELFSCGEIAQTEKQARPEFTVHKESFRNDREEIEIIVQVSNYHHRKGGILSPVFFGTEKSITVLRENNLALDMVIFGSNFTIGLYFFFLFFMRKRDKTFLAFFLMCLLDSIKFLIINEIFIKTLFPALPWICVLKLEYILNIASAIFFNLFIYYLHPEYYQKKIGTIFNIAALICLVSIFVFSSKIISSFVICYFIVFVLFSCFSVYILLKAIFRKPLEILIFCSGLSIFIFIAFNDLLYNYQLIDSTEFSVFGSFSFIVSLGLVFSIRFTKRFNTAEYLSINLQKEVENKTQELKRESEKQKNFFINLAHETKTPLTLISNYLDSYMRGVKPSRKLEVIKKNMDKLAGDMLNLLDFEKLERNEIFYNHDMIVNFSERLNQNIPLFCQTAEERRQKFEFSIENDIYVRCDSCALDRIINNIVENAMKFTYEGGCIRITLHKNGNMVVFNVTDNGIGISNEQRENIFKPYYQINHKKSNLQGIGVGLNIVNNIVRQINGKILLESRENCGTSFSILLDPVLPCRNGSREVRNLMDQARFFKDMKADQQGKEIIDLPISVEKQAVILIVEDNEDMLEFLHCELAKKYTVYTSVNGKDALEKLKSIPRPDLIIADIMMDIMDGYQFHARIMQQPSYRSIPCIFITALTAREDKIKALENGIIDYIQKPFCINELNARLTAILTLQNRQKEDFIDKAVTALTDGFRNSTSDNHSERKNYEKLIKKYNISPRENEIIALVVKGFVNKEIGRHLKISTRTVENHLQSIYRKAEIQNKVELLNIFK